VVFWGSGASAQLGKVPPPQLVITAAAADATYIFIDGVNFDRARRCTSGVFRSRG
jgi:hypothetical protein